MRSGAEFDLQIIYEKEIDAPVEIARLRKDIERLEKDITMKEARLADMDFRSRAPKQVVDNLAATMVERKLELGKVNERLLQLENTSANT